jgi:hypothetical protein
MLAQHLRARELIFRLLTPVEIMHDTIHDRRHTAELCQHEAVAGTELRTRGGRQTPHGILPSHLSA